MKTVLVVDDEFGTLDVLVAALEDEGYRVLTAANGRRGLERLEELKPEKPDLVISDFMMPLMDGAAMVRAIRENPEFQDVPIIMMSAAPEAALRKHLDGYGAFLRKPFSIETLTRTIETILK